jgi:hypothetical protein
MKQFSAGKFVEREQTKCYGLWDLGDCNSERYVDKFVFSYCAGTFTSNLVSSNGRLALSEHTSGRSVPAYLTFLPP